MSEVHAAPIAKDDTLKAIALVTMLIDHVGYLLFPKVYLLRIIGRLSFPIFAFLLAKGVTRTTNPRTYCLRLAAFALISQIPYNLFTHHPLTALNNPNIFFTLFAGLLMLLILKHPSPALRPFALLVFLVAEPLHLSYSYYGLLLMLVFYWFEKKPIGLILGMVAASCQYYWQFDNNSQFFALAVLPIIIHQPKLNIKINKWFAYGFYPVHLTLLFLIYCLWF